MRQRKRPSNLYRVLYLKDQGGYVVYRHCFNEDVCFISVGVRAHKQAVFVQEDAAKDYCKYRNRMIDVRGDDSLA